METEPRKRILVEVPESWIPEMEAAAKKRFTSRHSFILQGLRRVLDDERDLELQETPDAHPNHAGVNEVIAARITPDPNGMVMPNPAGSAVVNGESYGIEADGTLAPRPLERDARTNFKGGKK